MTLMSTWLWDMISSWRNDLLEEGVRLHMPFFLYWDDIKEKQVFLGLPGDVFSWVVFRESTEWANRGYLSKWMNRLNTCLWFSFLSVGIENDFQRRADCNIYIYIYIYNIYIIYIIHILFILYIMYIYICIYIYIYIYIYIWLSALCPHINGETLAHAITLLVL